MEVRNSFYLSLAGISDAKQGCTVILSTYIASCLIWLRKGFLFMRCDDRFDDSYASMKQYAHNVIDQAEMLMNLNKAEKSGVRIQVKGNDQRDKALAFMSIVFVYAQKTLTGTHVNFTNSDIRKFCTSKMTIKVKDADIIEPNGFLNLKNIKQFTQILDNLNIRFPSCYYMSRMFSASDIRDISTKGTFDMLEITNLKADFQEDIITASGQRQEIKINFNDFALMGCNNLVEFMNPFAYITKGSVFKKINKKNKKFKEMYEEWIKPSRTKLHFPDWDLTLDRSTSLKAEESQKLTDLLDGVWPGNSWAMECKNIWLVYIGNFDQEANQALNYYFRKLKGYVNYNVKDCIALYVDVNHEIKK